VESSRALDSAQREIELVDAARSGSATAFTTLVDHYYPIILAYLLRQTGEPEWARDLAQETFLDAFRALDKLPEDRSFRAWLFVVARNNYRHALRRRRVRQFVSLEWLIANRRHPELALEDDAPDFVERDAVQQALNQLALALREPLVLLSLGYSLKEAADILEISHAAARQRASRGLRQLHDILTNDQGGSH
jgi:RNA polymerase sigma-70 factor (ECF subfamily)